MVGGTAFLLFPVTIGVAILRFHLYDLDVVVRKALIYGAFALFATLIYLGLVVGAGIWLGQDNSFLTMVAAVVVAVTFQPARARLTRFANRVVYGKRATPYEVLSEFSERVGGAYADEDVLPRMARILGEGIGADRADVGWPSTRSCAMSRPGPATSTGWRRSPCRTAPFPRSRASIVSTRSSRLGSCWARSRSASPRATR